MKNNKLEEFKNDIKDKKVAVLGIGISNVPAIKYLVSLGAKVSARDKNNELPDNLKELSFLDIEFVLGDNYLDGLEKYDYIFRSPGVKPFIYEIEKGRKGLSVDSLMKLAQGLSCSYDKILDTEGIDDKKCLP